MLGMVITTVSNATVPVHSSFTRTEYSAFHKTHFLAAPNLKGSRMNLCSWLPRREIKMQQM
jgi:hypothetical protein